MSEFLSKFELNELKRKVAFSALIGSHNYNLADEKSDKDYKLFVYPIIEDFYFSHQVSKNEKDLSGNDFDVKDFRFLTNLLSTANPAYLEILFSVDVKNKENSLYQDLLKNRDEIIHSHLSQMYTTSIGQIIERLKTIKKSNISYLEIKTQNGRSYCKALATALRLKNLISSFYLDDFKDFGNKLYYQNDNKMRQHLLNIKKGFFSESELANSIIELEDFVKQKNIVNKKSWTQKSDLLFSDIRDKNVINKDGFVYNKLLFDIMSKEFQQKCVSLTIF